MNEAFCFSVVVVAKGDSIGRPLDLRRWELLGTSSIESSSSLVKTTMNISTILGFWSLANESAEGCEGREVISREHPSRYSRLNTSVDRTVRFCTEGRRGRL